MAAVVVDANKRQLFETLFATPSIDHMLKLTPLDFELFVAHVFQSAGYTVQHVARTLYPLGPGVDLNLFVGPVSERPQARVEVRRYSPGNLLTFDDVAAFLGKLVLPRNRSVPGFLVTTSSFTKGALEAADDAARKLQLIEGDRLLRYITYIGGSRLTSVSQGNLTTRSHPITPNWLRTGDVVAKRTAKPPRTTRVLAVSNTKGGVAKTTTALNLAFALADLYQQRTLLIDLDGQGSVSLSLPRPLPSGTPAAVAKVTPPPPDMLTVTDYFLGRSKLNDLVRPTRFDELFLVPAQHEMYRLEFTGADRTRAEVRFMEEVRGLKTLDANGEPDQPFDWIVFDTPAGDTFYGRAALAAADYILLPVYAERFAIQGLKETLIMAKTIGALVSDIDRYKQRLIGSVVTRWRDSTNMRTSLVDIASLLQGYGVKIFKDHIPLDERIETAHRGTAQGQTRNIFRLTNTLGPAARAYDKVAKEIIDHVNRLEAQAGRHQVHQDSGESTRAH